MNDTPATPTSHRTDAEWQRWGEQDPYYGVITDERFRKDRLDEEAIQYFFQTGRKYAGHVLRVGRQQFVPKFKPRRVLDFGCGVGRLAVAFAEQGCDVVGVDVSTAMLAEARRNCERFGVSERVSLVTSDDELSQVEGEFDLIHSFIVFQHIDARRGRDIAARLIGRLAPGGIASLHFTYAKAWHAETFGQLPPPPPAPEPSRWPGPLRAARRVRAVEPAPAGADPEMQMNPYSLNELFFVVQGLRTRTCHVEFTDHGGELGVVMYFQRPAH